MGSHAKPVIISGAGVVGLCLAHGLKKVNCWWKLALSNDGPYGPHLG